MIRKSFFTGCFVCALLSGAAAFAESPEPRELKTRYIILPSLNTEPGYLTQSKFYLSCRPTYKIGNPARALQDIINEFPTYNRIMPGMFDGDEIYPLVLMWAVYYANSENADRLSAPYALGLLCGGKFDEAKSALLAIVDKNPDDYSAALLLGVLSMRDRELFKYLEAAYRQAPRKTITLVDFLASNIKMDVPAEQEWDFLDAYIDLFVRDDELFRREELPANLRHRLAELVRQKYFDGQSDRFLWEDKSREAVFRHFRELMNELNMKTMEEKIDRGTGQQVVPPLADGKVIYALMKPESLQKNQQALMQLLSPGQPMPSVQELTLLTAWGGFYAGQLELSPLPAGVEPEGICALFGEICIGEYAKAAELGRKLLEKNPDDFSVLVLLGVLAEKDSELFSYLEKAFAIDPLKTIYIIDYFIRCRIIPRRPSPEFLKSYTRLIYQYREDIVKHKISRQVANQLMNMIASGGLSASEEVKTLRSVLNGNTHEGSPSYEGFRSGKSMVRR